MSSEIPAAPASTPETLPLVRPTFAEAWRFWLKLGFISFGGPTAQISIMHTELVERRRWIDEGRFLHALNYCMLIPGPEAQQLAVYIGWLLHRTWGGVVAGSLFVLPSAFILWLLSYVYVVYGKIAWVEGVFNGLKPAVTAIVAAAVVRIGKKALKTKPMWVIAAAAFASIFFLEVPFPLIILSAGIIGFAGGKWGGKLFMVSSGHGPSKGSGATVAEVNADHITSIAPTWGRTLKVILICSAIWWLPIGGFALLWGPKHVVPTEGVFFSKAAMVTFGGAYAVLPYVAQQAVERFQWLSPEQMLHGLGLAETTPGPLIMVVQFVGFLGGWHHAAPEESKLLMATLGAAITTWATFVPCFLWILAGAPLVERMRNVALLNAALSAITAAVVGVVLNLAVWFALHVWFPKDTGVDYFAIAMSVIMLALIMLALIVRWKWDIMLLLAVAAAVGLLRTWF